MEIGERYFVRTLTFHYTGELVAMDEHTIVLVDAASIADSGRWTQAIAEGELSEVEPYPDGCKVTLFRSNIVEVRDWPHALPREQK